jgi:hypothetical protein
VNKCVIGEPGETRINNGVGRSATFYRQRIQVRET